MRAANPPSSQSDRRAGGAARAAFTRRQWLTRALWVGASALTWQAAAEEPRVPPRLQAELLAKVAAYDGRFVTRAAGQALVLVLVAGGNPESERFAAQIRAELGKQPRVGGVEHLEDIVRYSTPAELTRVFLERKPAIVYVAPGLSSEAAAIAATLAGADVLSVAAVANDVLQGIVLGFEVVSGKPKLLIHLARARRQNVAFKPELLRLARVIQ